ncbi:hypothetical protein CC86DRAFT_184246 [Ophiobolus disseminans]|uniref:Uncharacterized protein n=1 Tax=Ophiobolus disseminans TaxID=1469910 RepID=A0A6A7A8I8_9PLEO|nr:hypothetical protein CC86DRAFT_184246 [Ophiobolus disseminans]
MGCEQRLSTLQPSCSYARVDEFDGNSRTSRLHEVVRFCPRKVALGLRHACACFTRSCGFHASRSRDPRLRKWSRVRTDTRLVAIFQGPCTCGWAERIWWRCVSLESFKPLDAGKRARKPGGGFPNVWWQALSRLYLFPRVNPSADLFNNNLRADLRQYKAATPKYLRVASLTQDLDDLRAA